MGKSTEDRILTCGCNDTDRFVKDAFKILFPKKEMPPILHTLGVIKNKLLRTVVNGLTDGKEKYAYFLTYDDNEVHVWDLIKGVQIR